MLTILCVLQAKHNLERPDHGQADFWRTLGPTYVRKLFNGVQRGLEASPSDNYKLDMPWRFRVLTDSPDLLPEFNCLPLQGGAGWWSKLNIFRRDVGEGTTTALYLDLDNVLGPSGSLLRLLSCLSHMSVLHPELRRGPGMLMLDDVINPLMRNASTMLFDPKVNFDLWEGYVEKPAEIEKRYSVWPHASDQAWISATRNHPMMWQDFVTGGQILNSRAQLENGADWSKTDLVYGSWHPKPHTSKHEYYRRYWV